MGFVDPVRLCAACVVPTRAEKEFFENDLKSLFDGKIIRAEGSGEGCKGEASPVVCTL